jgi:tRNA 2-selenouridine synthase
VDFENKIALDLMAVKQKYPQRSIILEDESRNIGSRHLPTPLTNAMNRSPMIVIELSFDERIERIFQEYVIDRYQKTLACNQDNAEDVFADYLTDSLLRVQKRLGDERTTHILKLMKEAIQIQHKDNFNYHRQWLIAITRDYYDPMYVYQLKKREQKIVFKGNYQDVKEWLSELP